MDIWVLSTVAFLSCKAGDGLTTAPPLPSSPVQAGTGGWGGGAVRAPVAGVPRASRMSTQGGPGRRTGRDGERLPVAREGLRGERAGKGEAL